MRVLVVFAHPVESSFNATLHRTVVDALTRAGHQVDDLDLYAEGFNPCLTREERLVYHDTTRNLDTVAPYVERLRAAEAVVFVFPVWSYGVPAILKGWMDRLLKPGVGFTLNADGTLTRILTSIRAVAAVTSYGQPWWMVRLAIGDLPRAQIMGYFRRFCPNCRTRRYHALYHMNRATPERCRRFLARVEQSMLRFG
jgi:putative NADPH-quinone reductase